MCLYFAHLLARLLVNQWLTQ